MLPLAPATMLHDQPELLEGLCRTAIERLSRSPAPDGIVATNLVLALAEALILQRRIEEARTLIKSVLQQHPENRDAQWRDAQISFYRKDPWPLPWEKLESRWGMMRNHDRLVPRDREWDGSPLRGRTLLFAGEGGLGDEILFIRFIPMLLKAGAGRIIVIARPRLIPLLRTAYDVEFVRARPPHSPLDPSLRYDQGLAFMSAPRLLRLTEANIPPPVRFVLPPGAVEAARQRIALNPLRSLNVGICWLATEKARSFPAGLTRAIADVPGLTLYALLEPQAFEKQNPGFPIENLGSDTIIGTAGAVAALDLIISVDTMVAHLAGSLGKPVWLLTNFVEDWRWCAKGEATPWYPKMRIFRREEPGWEGLIRRVCAKLADMTASLTP